MELNNKKILDLFSDYSNKSISESGYRELKLWLEKSPENRKMFSKHLHFYKKSRQIGFVENLNQGDAWQKVLEKINEPIKIKSSTQRKVSEVRHLNLTNFLRYAAVIIVVASVAYSVFQNSIINTHDGKLLIAEEEIILEMESGLKKKIDLNTTQDIEDSSGNLVGIQSGKTINYNKIDNAEKLVYNKLTVPYGKKIQVILSDGTKVHLNAGSAIKYPIKFLEGESRKVFLLSGEAYFDVVSDERHPFIVNNSDMNVRVLGTEFNISTYQEDETINTVLVEGSVALYDEKEEFSEVNKTVLEPGYMASWSKTDESVVVSEVEVSNYTSWIDGKLVFKNTSFKKIIKKLERNYNVTIINNNETLNVQYYDATFDVETIEQVLNSFSKSFAIEYTIEDNKIIIN